jgi:hypothetical protein
MAEPPPAAAGPPVGRLDRLRAQLRGLGADDPQRAGLVLADQIHGWRSGEPLPADVYLDLLGAAGTFSEDGFDLIYGEWELRRERGETPDLATFQARFPAYAEALRQQVALDEYFTAPPALLTSPHGSGASGVDPAKKPALPAAFGRYRILGEIARGGMGLVCRGHDPALERELAVRVLLDQYRDQPDLARRFLTEARICSQLQHPGIVPLHDIGTLPDGRLFFAMKLV